MKKIFFFQILNVDIESYFFVLYLKMYLKLYIDFQS